MSDSDTESERQDERIRSLPVRRLLPCPLSEQEQLELARRTAQVEQELMAVDEEYRRLKAEKYAELKAKSVEFSECLAKMRAGAEDREVECEERYDYGNGTVYVVRLDTLDVVETRSMTPQERQQKLDLPEPDQD